MPERLGAIVPHPFSTPLASFTCGPTKGYVSEPFPCYLAPLPPAIPQHTGISAFKLSLLTPSHSVPGPLL